MAPRTDFTPDYTPDYAPDGAGGSGGAIATLPTATVSVVPGLIPARGTLPNGGGLVGFGRMRYREPAPRRTRAGQAVLVGAEISVEAAMIPARGTATGSLGALPGGQVTAGVIHAHGVRNPSEEELCAMLLAIGEA